MRQATRRALPFLPLLALALAAGSGQAQPVATAEQPGAASRPAAPLQTGSSSQPTSAPATTAVRASQPAQSAPAIQAAAPAPFAVPLSPDAPPALRRPGPLSTRIVSYRIRAELDPGSHTVLGHEHVTWRNDGSVPAPDLALHLYMNAFKNESSTFFKELREMGEVHGLGPDEVGDGEWGAIDVTGFKLADGTNLLKGARVDDTVMTVKLPVPILAGQTLEADIDFVTRLPKVVARSGWFGDFHLVGQWYPELGVWQDGAWNCHQYHATSEFFADFGLFDVDITTPAGWAVGATGVQVGEQEDAAKKTITRRFHAEDVHDFVWTAAPWLRELDGSFVDGEPIPVAIRVLYPPGSDGLAARHLAAAQAALRFYGDTFFPYPYSTLTVLVPPPGAGAAGGMEYPTFFTTLDAPRFGLGSALFSRSHYPEAVTMHEFGHQYFCQMVATNEFEEAWLDEGLTEYTSALAMQATYGQADLYRGRALRVGSWDLDRAMYLRAGDWDPMETDAWRFADDEAYGATSYGKTSMLLHTLDGWLGRERLLGALRAYAVRYAFQHPRDADFEAALSQGAGTDLSFILGPAIHGTGELDYEVASVDSAEHEAAAGLFDDASGKRGQITRDEARKQGRAGGGAAYDSEVLLHRAGDLAFPVDVVVRFSDGSQERATWDGRERWKRLVFAARSAPAIGAEIDPERKVWLDRDVLNNSLSTEPDTRTESLATEVAAFFEETALQAVGL